MDSMRPNKEYLLLFEDFYEEFHDKLYRYILRKIGDSEDADDLVSEIFLYCYEHFSDYDPNKSPIGAWLYMIAKSRLLNYYRDHKITLSLDLNDVDFEDPSTKNSMEKAMELMDLRDKMAAAISSLSPIQQRLIILRYFRGCTTTQMALETGLTSSNVRTILSRALDKMESYWKYHGWEL